MLGALQRPAPCKSTWAAGMAVTCAVLAWDGVYQEFVPGDFMLPWRVSHPCCTVPLHSSPALQKHRVMRQCAAKPYGAHRKCSAGDAGHLRHKPYQGV